MNRTALAQAPVSVLEPMPGKVAASVPGGEGGSSRQHVVRAMVTSAMGPGSDDETAADASDSLPSDSDASERRVARHRLMDSEALGWSNPAHSEPPGHPAPLRTRRRATSRHSRPRSAAKPFSPAPEPCEARDQVSHRQSRGRAEAGAEPLLRAGAGEAKQGELSFGQDVDLWPMLRSALRNGDTLHGSSTLTLAPPSSPPSADSADELAGSAAEGDVEVHQTRLEFAAGDAAQLEEEARRVSHEWDELRESGLL